MKTVIITGANSGLGFETVKKIAQNKGYEVILACRNKERAEKAREDIVKETKNENVKIMILDTSSLSSVRNFVNDVKKLNIKIDSLVCNAGISGMNSGTTEDGFELVFATNFIKGNGNRLSDTIVKMMGRMGDLDMSSTALTELVVNNDFNNITGKYFDRSTKYIDSSELSYNGEHRLELWNKSVEYTNLTENETIKGIIGE